jgi:hypothetical protein
MPNIYKITYSNGKIYVGSDLTDTVNYYGSAQSARLAEDFKFDGGETMSIRKDILWYS